MEMPEFLRRQMSENGEPSNNRVMLFLFLTMVCLMVFAAAIVPAIWAGRVFALPTIPPSFETFVEVITATLVGGSVLGKGVAAYRDKGTASTSSSEIISRKDVTNVPPAPPVV
jgi:hypothetical protein